MKSACRKAVLFSLLFVVLFGYATAESEEEVSRKLISAPHKNVRTNVIDGTGNENTLGFEDINNGIGETKGGNSKVSISTVALFTLAMAAATGLGVVPFFFVELDPQWAGLCAQWNGCWYWLFLIFCLYISAPSLTFSWCFPFVILILAFYHNHIAITSCREICYPILVHTCMLTGSII
ncbi:hypothetical protein RchiOBHm_Chr3g0459981 [Rosa chinensis]|uniref:Uncharacterized protein n=1 Tax=Rosa chinensis TaxID=74649 RepID=A0A2P6R8B8_ROSCH|nr:hypothetical protein RchiOBHm_Chr3g0459981 [Rosa chinensis]